MLAAMMTLEEARSSAQVRVARLGDGATAYEVHGESGPWVVLVHGLLSPMAGFLPLARRLGAAGFRVLRYDMFGRGLSDRPAVRYDPALYVRQLRELTESLSIERMHLGSWSMGAIVAGRFALEHAARVDRLLLIAPALFTLQPLALRMVRRLPGAARLIARQAPAMVRALPRQHFRDSARVPGYLEQVSAQLAFPGLGESLASTLENFAWGYGPELREVGQHQRRVLAVWGDADPVTPFANAPRVCELFPRASLLTVPGALHAPHLEHADVVEPAVERFLRSL
jgi:pimeloyl-ACP methyl ester carboxylesterase